MLANNGIEAESLTRKQAGAGSIRLCYVAN